MKYNTDMLTQKTQDVIIEFARSRPIEVVYFFGSRAIDTAKPLSDYDFGLLFSNELTPQERFNLKIECSTFLMKLLGTEHIDVVDLNSAPATLRYSALSPRKDIYTRSESTRVNFEHATLNEYFDRLFYLKRHSRDSLATIAQEGL